MGTRVVPAIALVATLVGLAGCGDSSDSQGASQSETATTAPVVTTAPPPAEPTDTTPASEPASKPTTITIRVVGGSPEGGIARPSIKKNDRVALVVWSDTADEVHLHGYDISRAVAAGGRVRMTFVAKIPGRFEVELERSGVQLAELTVR